MPNTLLKYQSQDSSFLRDCSFVLQLISHKQEICTPLNLQIDFEYKLFKEKDYNPGDLPYRFRKCLDFLIRQQVIHNDGKFLTLNKDRLDNFFNKLVSNNSHNFR